MSPAPCTLMIDPSPTRIPFGLLNIFKVPGMKALLFQVDVVDAPVSKIQKSDILFSRGVAKMAELKLMGDSDESQSA